MPFIKAQSVSTPFDKDFLDETLDQGSTGQTVFNMTVSMVNIYLTPFTLKYTVGSSPFTATTDSAGNLTGTHISSGTVSQNGNVDVTFSTEPDDGTDIDADYRTRGVLTEIIDYVTNGNAQNSETIDSTPNGILTTFSGTLAQFPVARGQVRIEFTIASTTYRIWDDGTGQWEHPEITSSSLNYTSGAWSITFANPPDDTTDIDAIYSTSTIEGRDWVVLLNTGTRDNNNVAAFPSTLHKEVVIKNSGASYKENIYVGFRECESAANAFFALQLNVYFQRLQDDGDWNDNRFTPDGHGQVSYDGTRELWSGMPRISLNEDTLNYWIYVSKNRITGFVEVTGSRFESYYAGLGLRFGAPSEYENPLVAVGSHAGTNNFTDTGSAHSMIIDIASNGDQAIYVDPRNKYGTSETTTGKAQFSIYGYAEKQVGSVGNFTFNTDGSIPTWPCYGYSERDKELLFELEGVKGLMNDQIQSEDTVTESGSGDVYTVAQNVFRTGFDEFMGIREE